MEYGDRPSTRHTELGSFLRLRRGSLRPQDLGLHGTGRRHVKGLRREELAEAAGIGASWYTLLEQGRAPNVSPRALGRIADALRLNEAERRHVFTLATNDAGPPASAAPPQAVLDYVRSGAGGAAILYDGAMDVVAWNAAADDLFGFSERGGRSNVLEMLVRDARCRAVFEDPTPDRVLRDAIGQARAAAARHRSPDSNDRFAALRAESDTFARLWDEHPVAPAPTARLRVVHPSLGSMLADAISFGPVAAPGFTMLVLALPER